MYKVIIVFEYGSEVFDIFDTADQAEDKVAELRTAGYMARMEAIA